MRLKIVNELELVLQVPEESVGRTKGLELSLPDESEIEEPIQSRQCGRRAQRLTGSP